MKVILSIILFAIAQVPLIAQKENTSPDYNTFLIDSFRSGFATTNNDTAKARYLVLLSWAIEGARPDSALIFAKQSYEVAKSNNLVVAQASALRAVGYHQLSLGDYPEALKTFYQALEVLGYPVDLEDNTIPDSNLNNMGRDGIQEYADIHRNIGFLYGAVGNTAAELAQHKKALHIHKALHNEQIIANTTWNIADVYLQMNNPDSAILLAQEGLAYYQRDDVPFYVKTYRGTVYNILGNAYLDIKDYSMAEDALLKGELANTQFDNRRALISSYLNLAALYMAKDDLDKSLMYANKAKLTAEQTAMRRFVAKSYAALAESYKALNKHDSAYYFFQLTAPLTDSLHQVERRNLVRYQNALFDENRKLEIQQQEKTATQNRIRIFSLLGSLGFLLVIALLLYRNNRQKQKTNKVLETTLNNLKATQAQLIQSEKMASLGELTAGIAHEIQNPLNFVNNFSEVNEELMSELVEELNNGNSEEAKVIADAIRNNTQKINEHGKRADAIVKGMLQHSRSSSGQKESTDINALCDEYLRLSYHGLRAKDKSFNATLKTEFDNTIGAISIVPQDIGRVLLNLINNAFFAVDQKKKTGIKRYDPTVTVITKRAGDKVSISVQDNGTGIPDSVKAKIFQPFFTTKPTGQGTGLGLSLSYDMVKAHGGEIEVNTIESEGTEFIIQLPIQKNT